MRKELKDMQSCRYRNQMPTYNLEPCGSTQGMRDVFGVVALISFAVLVAVPLPVIAIGVMLGLVAIVYY
jgi:hypothetical protein